MRCFRGSILRKNKNDVVWSFEVGWNRQKCRKFSLLDQLFKATESILYFTCKISNYFLFLSRENLTVKFTSTQQIQYKKRILKIRIEKNIIRLSLILPNQLFEIVIHFNRFIKYIWNIHFTEYCNIRFIISGITSGSLSFQHIFSIFGSF